MIKEKVNDQLTVYFVGYNPANPTLALLKDAVKVVPGMEKNDAIEYLLREAGNHAIVVIPDFKNIIFYKR